MCVSVCFYVFHASAFYTILVFDFIFVLVSVWSFIRQFASIVYFHSLSLSLSFPVSLAVTIPLLHFSFSAFSLSLPLLLFLSLLLSHSLTHSLSPLSPSHSITLYIYFPLFLTHLNSLLSHPSFLFSFDTAHNFLTLNASYCTYWYDVCVYLHICPSVPVCSNVL